MFNEQRSHEPYECILNWARSLLHNVLIFSRVFSFIQWEEEKKNVPFAHNFKTEMLGRFMQDVYNINDSICWWYGVLPDSWFRCSFFSLLLLLFLRHLNVQIKYMR